MEFIQTTIPGLVRIKPFTAEDKRGTFVKTFQAEDYQKHGLDPEFRESFFSESLPGVVRGMHFQVLPKAHTKLVYCMQGEILDVILDIRKDSPAYGKFEAFTLSEENRELLYVPKGCAHGFCSPKGKALVVYMVGTENSREHDKGIRYDSFGFDWPVKSPIISDRDLSFPEFTKFDSPF